MCRTRMSVLSCVTLFLCVVSNPIASADPASAVVSASLNRTSSANATSLTIINSTVGIVSAGDSLGNYYSTLDLHDGSTDASAKVVVPTASGTAYTTSSAIFTEAISKPPSSVQSFAGLHSAMQRWSFKAETDGFVTFDFDLSRIMNLQTDGVGEWAYGDLRAYAGISFEYAIPNRETHWQHWWDDWFDGDDSSTYWSFGIGAFGDLCDGADYLLSETVPFSVRSLSRFEAGQVGYLTLYVRSASAACSVAPVPAPAGLLLGLLGLGAAGAGLRREARAKS